MKISHLDINDDSKFIVLYLVCERFKKWKKDNVSSIIDTLRKVYKLHRDFRKWNLLRDQDGSVRIADWGFAVNVNETTTFAGSLCGVSAFERFSK